MKSILLFFYLMSSFVFASVDCSNPAPQQCAFYRQCLEASRPCGLYGYALKFGERNCNKFLAVERKLSPHGQLFSKLTRTCLQKKLSQYISLNQDSLSCKKINDFAFSTHVACYTDHVASICDINPKDLAIVLWNYDLQDTLRPRSIAQMISVSAICLKRWASWDDSSEQKHQWEVINAQLLNQQNQGL